MVIVCVAQADGRLPLLPISQRSPPCSVHSSIPCLQEAYIHAPSMYNISAIKNRKLKFGLAVSACVGLGCGIPLVSDRCQVCALCCFWSVCTESDLLPPSPSLQIACQWQVR